MVPDLESGTARWAMTAWRRGAATLLLGASGLLACGSHDGGALGSDDGGGGSNSGSSSSGSSGSNGGSGSANSGSSSGPVFTSQDAAPAGVTFECEPGTYSGMFATTVGNDAGGIFSLFSIAWTGMLSITLQGSVMDTATGEIPSPTLTIAPGAKLDGTDAYGGHFVADLSGMLDCPTKTLSVTVANGNYTYPYTDAGGVALTGMMSATYDSSGSAPQLTMGQMNLGSPQIGAEATGTWSATLQ